MAAEEKLMVSRGRCGLNAFIIGRASSSTATYVKEPGSRFGGNVLSLDGFLVCAYR
ncbi:30S ribosomal protein S6 [Anopheles sinensis]|uniref:30S ribosomal protein S6 n=1 Tax=Anopheles sinensis TaxID=74873 RepID=A0A084WTY2_ANOSI|nr:30S ribosomal protein S6 [Anopheles sinensis]